MLKEEVHTEVRPKGPVLFPDVLGLGEGRRTGDKWRERPGLTCVCDQSHGVRGQEVEGEFFALLRV